MSKTPLISRTPVDEDDLCEIIYHMLWNKNVFYPSSTLPIYIPDTVMFRTGVPAAWYFSDSEGIIRRKKEPKLNNQHVLDIFLRKKSKYGIIAYYIHIPDAQEIANNPSLDESKQKTIIEYYDEPAFIKLLSNTNKLKRGILQRFIEPQGERNSLIQCIWTKRISMFNRRTNCRLLKDPTANIYEKCVTFEGPTYMSESSAMKGTALGVKVKEALDFIINHISNATFEKYNVSKLVCYFKVDHQSRIWYLFSGFFRVNRKVIDIALKTGRIAGDSIQDIDLNDNFTIPSNIHVGPKMVGAYRKPEETLETCPRCGSIYSGSNFVEITYQAIMDAGEKSTDINGGKADESENVPNVGMLLAPDIKVDEQKAFHVRNKQADIPYIIRKVHSRLRSHEFEKIKNEDYFKIKKTRVCYSCFFYLSKTNIMGGNDQNPNSIQEKIMNPRPIGQTLSMNEKLKAINDAKKKGDTSSASPMKQLSMRANSVGNLSQRDKIVSLKRDNEQTSRAFGNVFENPTGKQGSERAKYREETIRFELQRLQSREEFTKHLATSQVTDIIKHVQPVDLSSQPNIFETREIGKIVKLDGLPPKPQSMNNVSMPAATPQSRSSSFSRKSNNYMNELYTMIQGNGSPQGTSEFQKVSFIPEQTDRFDTEDENLNRQLLMSEPISLSAYKKPVQLSRLPVRETLKARTMNTKSLSERIPRSVSQESDFKKYIAKQMAVPEEVTNENTATQNRTSYSRVNSNVTIRERASSVQRDTNRSSQTDHVQSMIKLYMGGKIPVQKIPPTKRGFNKMKFSYDGKEGLKIRHSTDKKGVRGKHVSDLFRPLNKTTNANSSWRGSPIQEAQAVDNHERNSTKLEVITTKFSTTTDNFVPKTYGEEQDWVEEEKDDDEEINEVIDEPEVPVIKKPAALTERQKTSEPTLISQFPTHTNNSLTPFKSSETPERAKYMTFTKEDEKGKITDLDYSLTQPLKTSMLRKDTFPVGSSPQDTESRKSRSRSPRLDDKEVKEFENRVPYVKRIPDEQFDELTAKPFSSKRSLQKGDSQTFSKNSGHFESQKASQDYALPANLITDEDDKAKTGPGIGSQKSSLDNEAKKSGNTSARFVIAKKSEGSSEEDRVDSREDEKIPVKKISNQELSRLINSVGIKYGIKNSEGETIKIEDERRPSF